MKLKNIKEFFKPTLHKISLAVLIYVVLTLIALLNFKLAVILNIPIGFVMAAITSVVPSITGDVDIVFPILYWYFLSCLIIWAMNKKKGK